MGNLIRRYKAMSYGQKILANTIIGLCFSAAFACAKLVIGCFKDFNLCSIAVYTFAILLSKLQFVLAVKSEKRTFGQRSLLAAVFLLISSVLYIGFNCRLFFFERAPKAYGISYVCVLAFISFAEIGFAVAGLIKTKNEGLAYRNIKIINFGMGLIAILTTQTAILDFTGSTGVDIYNASSGIGVGCVIAISAVYILLAPKISVTGREHNIFVLKEERALTGGAAHAETAVNKPAAAVTAQDETAIEIMLCKSFVYGSYAYRARLADGTADGNIERDKSLWKRAGVVAKIIFCILSEILIFVWLAGRAVFFLRSRNLPRRLQKIMSASGFVRTECGPLEKGV